MPRRLETSYIPADTNNPVLDEPIGSAIERSAKMFGENTALVDGIIGDSDRRRWSYAQVYRDALKLAQALLEDFEPGDHVAIWASNSPEWVLVEFGASLAGIVLVTVNPAYLAHELKYVLEQSEVVGIILEDCYRGRDLSKIVEQTQPDLPTLKKILLLSRFDELLHPSNSVTLPTVSADALAQIQYTSGTTGFPKGACLPHRGLNNNGRFYAETIGATSNDVWINPMPMFHTAGCGLATLGILHTGGTHVLPPVFDAGLMLDLIEREQGTIMLCVPTMLIRILEEQERRPRDVSSWRLITLGGAPVPIELIRRAERLIKAEIGIGFGQTEASPYLTHTRVKDEHPKWFETVGKPLPQTELKIIDPQSGDTVPIGSSGEICGRGYNIMAGYYNNTSATEVAIDKEGWLHTGDIGSLDENGYCRVQGRLRDMIIRGGENIYPKEIEEVLFTHPAIENAAVVGLPDPEWGEVVAACVLCKENKTVTDTELESYCRNQLASYKVPRRWAIMNSFPQTASGKVQKFALQEQLLSSQLDLAE